MYTAVKKERGYIAELIDTCWDVNTIRPDIMPA